MICADTGQYRDNIIVLLSETEIQREFNIVVFTFR